MISGLRRFVLALVLVLVVLGSAVPSSESATPRSGSAAWSFRELTVAASVAWAEVVPPPPLPPAIGTLVTADLLTQPGALAPTFCPSGQNFARFTPDGYQMTVTGRCASRIPVPWVLSDVHGVTLRDGEIELDVRGEGPVDRAILQLYVRMQAGGNGYQVTWSPELGAAELRRWNEGPGDRIALRIDLPPVSLAEGATIGLRAQGPAMWLMLNGEPVLYGRDDTSDAIDTGSVALGLLRDGGRDDEGDLSVVVESVRLSRLAGGEAARAPTFERSAAQSTTRSGPPSGSPPATGATLYEEPLNQAQYGPTRISVFYPGSTCPTGNGSIEFVDEGLRMETRGKCYDVSKVARVGPRPSPFVDVPDGEIRLEFKVRNGYRRATISVTTREKDGEDGLYGFLVVPNLGVASIAKIGDGADVNLGRREDIMSLLSRDDWNSLAIRMQGSQLWMLVNDRPVLVANDSSRTRGGFTVNVDRMGSLDDGEQVEILLRNLRIAEIKGTSKDRRPSGGLHFPGVGR